MLDAIAHYHDLLTPSLAQESQAVLDAQLQRRELVFGGRPLCTVLRPRLTTPERHRLLATRVRALMRVFATAYEAAIDDRALRAQFRLADWEETLVADDPGVRNPSPTSRLDAFIVDDADQMKLTEYNAETPAGAAFTDTLSDVFLDLPVVREFAKRYELRPLPAQHAVLAVLLDSYFEFSGRRGLPRVAILDWNDVPTVAEFRMYQRYFRSLGIQCSIGDPRDADYRDGKLIVEGEPVDLIYKRVLITELVERCGMDGAVIRAVRERAVHMANGFRSKILHKKASLAVLTDERNAHLFSADDRLAIDAFIPWTRVVEERKTEFAGRSVDLLPFIEREQQRLVLKPNDDYGGAGIVLGWTVDAEAWRDAIRVALASPYIVQERVTIPYEPYPSLVDGQAQVVDRMQDTAPFVSYASHMDGCLTRLSTAALLNVTAGGGSTVPTFVVERRG